MALGVTPDYTAVTSYLFGLKSTHGLKFGIDRMRLFAAALDHPEQRQSFIHVAGTNGKGSVVAMLDAILHAAGWHTGMYTSPHLVKLGERVQVDRTPLTEDEITAYVTELRPIAETLAKGNPDDHPSFFEFMTAMALLQFRRRQCDIALLEVGLGGRLDATNIITPKITVITSIGMDHCEMLGTTYAAIAGEKAGIIKQGIPVVVGRVPPEAETVIRARAAELGSPLRSVREEFGEEVTHYPHTNLEGDYQRWNAATATLTARVLGERWRITEQAIVDGLTHVDWPGRWQRVKLGNRLLILDASHNPEGAEVLESNLRSLVAETGRKPVVITGVLGTVRARPLLATIAQHASAIHLVVPHQPRATSQSDLAALIPAEYKGTVTHTDLPSLFPSADQCTAGEADDVIVVTGSIYLIGEVMTLLGPQVGEGHLQDF